MLAVLRPTLRFSRAAPLIPTTKPYILTSNVHSTSEDAVNELIGDLREKRPSLSAYPSVYKPEGGLTDNDGPPRAPSAYATTNQLSYKNPRTSFTIPAAPPPLPRYRLFCNSNMNNTTVTFTKENGEPLQTVSAGMCGFKGANRSSYEAGYQCAVAVFKAVAARDMEMRRGLREPKFALDVIFKGFGRGRDAVQTALLGTEGEKIRSLVASVGDHTPIKIGGTRAKKARRS